MQKLLVVICLCLLARFTATSAEARRVFIVMEENHSFNEVIGNSAMPYLNGLAKSYVLATNYYAVTHPSIGNYFSLTTGRIITNNDNYSSTVYVDNIVRHLIAAGKTWKEYSEGLPSVGYFGGDYGGYVQHHNPCSYFTDVRNNLTQRQKLVPSPQLQTDINNNALPDFGFIVPNNSHNGHNGNLSAADTWLKTNIAPLIAHLGVEDLLLIVFDEADGDSRYGGGKVPVILVGPDVRKGYQSSRFYQHPNALVFMSHALHIGVPTVVTNVSSMNQLVLP